MASSNDNVSMALFCDFENVALGVRDANYDKFDIKPVLERLLLKGSIVVKKAYCDWERYKGFKASMHEANFELIEIPHLRMSGKNSADIRMVVDALDLCYTKSHVDTFVIISGDSDFSPLVSKLRENAKKVIGVGVKQSTSDLLVANCDEFIFYDDLVRESRRARRDAQPAVKRSPEEETARRAEKDKRREQAMEIIASTFEALMAERGDSGKIWASVLKEAIKRRKPDFSESYYGFRTFGLMLEEARARGLLEFGRDEKSGAYVYRGSGVPAPAPVVAEGEQDGAQGGQQEGRADGGADARGDNRFEPRRSGRGGRGGRTAAERFEERQARRAAEQGGQEGAAEAQSPWYAPAPQHGEAEAVQAAAPAKSRAAAPAAVADDVAGDVAPAAVSSESLAADSQPSRAKSGKNKQPARKAKADAKAKAAKEAANAAQATEVVQAAPGGDTAHVAQSAHGAQAAQSAHGAQAAQTAAEAARSPEAAAAGAPDEAPEAGDAGKAASGKRPAKGRQGGGKAKAAKPAAKGGAAAQDSASPAAKGSSSGQDAASSAAKADSSVQDAASRAADTKSPAEAKPAAAGKSQAKSAAAGKASARGESAPAGEIAGEGTETAAKPARKPSSRGPRRPAKPKTEA